MPVHLETTCRMSSSSTFTRFSSRVVRHSLSTVLQFFLGLLFLVAHGGGAFEILVLDRAFLLGLDLLDLAFEFLDFRRTGHRADARARTGFVHHINGLVRQIAVGDVAVRKFDRGFDGFVGELGLVMVFVLRAQTFQNQDGFLDRKGLRL